MRRLAGLSPPFSPTERDVTYAIIEVAGKQYRVREGERLLVDRLAVPEGATLAPSVLLVGGGDGGPLLDPPEGTVSATVVRSLRGPKVRIGKYRRRTGYRRHRGFRAALTEIRIDAIGPERRRRAARSEGATPASEATPAAGAEGALPEGYDALTVAALKEQAGSWTREQLQAALAHERVHGKRKGAVAALEAALARKEGES